MVPFTSLTPSLKKIIFWWKVCLMAKGVIPSADTVQLLVGRYHNSGWEHNHSVLYPCTIHLILQKFEITNHEVPDQCHGRFPGSIDCFNFRVFIPGNAIWRCSCHSLDDSKCDGTGRILCSLQADCQPVVRESSFNQS